MGMPLNRAGDDVIYRVLVKWLATENILVTLMTEGKMAHFSFKVYDRIPDVFITDKYVFFRDGMSILK